MELKLDLHIHSAASPDGRMSLAEIVAGAKAAGLQGVAICDHDRVCLESCPDPAFLLVPGAEFSTEYGHLLGLFLTGPIDPAPFPSLVAAIHAQGGLAVLAHPFQHSRNPGRIEPVVSLLDGIEVWNSRADRKNRQANRMAQEFAQAHGLPGFAGSDAHVSQEIGRGFITVQADNASLSAVRAALAAGGGACGGGISPSRYVAQSQKTKLKKEGGSPAAYAKWLLFAAKCRGEDLLRHRDYQIKP